MLTRVLHSTIFWVLLSISILVAVYWRWVFTPDIYAWGDWGYQNREFVRQLFYFPQAWLKESMGSVDIGLPQYLTARLLYSFFAQFLPFVAYDRIVFLIPSSLLSAVSIFLLVKQNSQSKIAALVGAMVYSLNTYILLLNTGHLTLSTAFSIGPFVFMLFKQAVDKRSLKYALASGLVGFICAGYEPRGFYMLTIILMMYLFYSVFLINNQINNIKLKVKSLTLGFLAVGIIFLSGAYWIIAAAQTIQSYEGIAIDRQLAGEHDFAIPRAMLLFSPWWNGGNIQAPMGIQISPVYFWLIPFMAFLGFWVNRKKPATLFWMIVSLIGIFLVKSSSEPFGGVYPWLYNHLPGFNLFRDASKFDYYVSLGYAVLIGEFIAWLWHFKAKSSDIKIIITVITLSIFLYNGFLVARGQVGHLMTPRYIPDDYVTLKSFIQNQPSFFRVLYVPQFPRWVYRDNDRRMLGLVDMLQTSWNKYNNYNKTGLEYSSIEDLSNLFYKPYANDLLDESSVKYIVVPIEDLQNEEDFLYPKGTDMQQYVTFLSGLKYLKRIDIGTKDLVVFENMNSVPYFSFNQNINYLSNCPDATTCTLQFNSAASNLKLNFSEQFHQGWKIRIGDFHWWNSLLDSNYFLPNQFHQSSAYGVNQFTIPEVNPGSKVTIYFSPQAYVNIGTIISLITLFLSGAILWKIWKQ